MSASAHAQGSHSHPLLSGRIVPTLLRLALPNVLANATVVLVGTAETFYIGRLGIEPLAAIGLVFPFAMLTGMLSAGAMGGGVASAISRAVGAGDTARAQAIALHALVIGAVAGLLYSLLLLGTDRWLFAALGGRGAVLEEALAYAGVLFSGAVLVWLFNTLASVVRGTGDMRTSSAAVIGVGLLQVACGGALGLGLGPIPRLGMPGVAWGQVLAMSCGLVFLGWVLLSGQARLRLRLRGVGFSAALFADILRVGATACLSPLQSVSTMVLMAAFVARLGVLPLAGYAIGQRLEFLMSTVASGVGMASLPMVGMAIGAAQVRRARRTAWAAGGVAGLVVGVVGLLVAWQPDLWAALFTRDQAVLGFARQYLHWAGPAFGLFAFGLALFFASQGAGRMAGPVLAATARLALVGIGGAWLLTQGASAWQLFALAGAAMAVYGLASALALRLATWGERPARRG